MNPRGREQHVYDKPEVVNNMFPGPQWCALTCSEDPEAANNNFPRPECCERKFLEDPDGVNEHFPKTL